MPSPARPRRTQEERTNRTRTKLLDATLASLLEVGYAGTTTRRVADAAGVSQGAQTHHFRRRVDLVTAAIEHATDQRVAALQARITALPTDPAARTRAAIDLIWEDFSGPLFAVFVKLWVAAAEDPELYERLIPLERRLARQIATLLPALTPALAPEEATARLTVAFSALRGLALSHAFEPVAGKPRDPWPAVAPVLERLLLSP